MTRDEANAQHRLVQRELREAIRKLSVIHGRPRPSRYRTRSGKWKGTAAYLRWVKTDAAKAWREERSVAFGEHKARHNAIEAEMGGVA